MLARIRAAFSTLACVIALAPTLATAEAAQSTTATTTPPSRDLLAGTAWRLVRFQGGDGSVLAPDDRSKYTIELDAKGGVAARIDCNRGRGTWTSSGANEVRFGPMALTRAACPPGSLHDQIVRQWGNIRSYVIKDGHLFLSLMADGGTYEFEPAGEAPAAFRSPVPAAGPNTWICASGGASPDTLGVTFYETQPAMALLERGGVTRPAFQVRAASGARFEGDGVLFSMGPSVPRGHCPAELRPAPLAGQAASSSTGSDCRE